MTVLQHLTEEFELARGFTVAGLLKNVGAGRSPNGRRIWTRH